MPGSRIARVLGAGLAALLAAAALTAPATAAPSATPSVAAADTCAPKPKPAGKVLQGYWENWDGAANGVHPPFGWAPIDDPRFAAHGYNVINAAFPVIRSDGTVLWEDGMDNTVRVGTPAQMCNAKAAGATLLLSIGGAAAESTSAPAPSPTASSRPSCPS